jgi:hypothetical protein
MTQNIVLDYSRRRREPPRTRRRREAARRVAQHAGGLAAAFLVAGFAGARLILRTNGVYGDELLVLLLFAAFLASAAVMLVALCVWLVALVQARRWR